MLDRSFPVSGPLDLHCEFRNGSLTVHARDDLTQARVSITPRESDAPVEQLFRVELTGTRLDVLERSEDGGSWLQGVLGGDLRGFARNRIFGRAEMDVVVELPAGSTAKVSILSAAVQATGRLGATSVSSGAADIELDLVDGPLHVRSGSGSLSANRVTGPSSVRGGSGQVRIGEITGALTVAAGSGEVAVGRALNAVRVRSGSGSTQIDVAEADVDVASSSGPVTVGLPPGQQARLDVASGSGRLHTEMPMQDARPSGHAITIRVRTGAGDVIVRRAVAVTG